MSFLLVRNNTATTLTGAGQINLGNAIHGCGRNIVLNNNSIQVNGEGYYEIKAIVNASITGTAAATVELDVDGTVANSVTITPSAAGANVEYVIPWVIRNRCNCKESTITLKISAGATINNVTVIVGGGKL